MGAVAPLLGSPSPSRRNLRNQEGIEGVGRVDEDNILTGGQQRGDRPKRIGEDRVTPVEQDEATLRPPTVEGEGELRKKEPGRRNPFHVYNAPDERSLVIASDCKACPEPRRRERGNPGISNCAACPERSRRGHFAPLQ